MFFNSRSFTNHTQTNDQRLLKINRCIHCFSAQDPCQTTVILGGDVKRSFDNVKSFNDIENGYCDISLRDGWYRLKVGNKDVGLAPSAPPPGACNAFYPIWMNGTSVAVF